MEFLICISIRERIRCVRALTALVAGAGKALWAKAVTGGIRLGLLRVEWSRVGSAGLCRDRWASEQKGSRGSGGKGKPTLKAVAGCG